MNTSRSLAVSLGWGWFTLLIGALAVKGEESPPATVTLVEVALRARQSTLTRQMQRIDDGRAGAFVDERQRVEPTDSMPQISGLWASPGLGGLLRIDQDGNRLVWWLPGTAVGGVGRIAPHGIIQLFGPPNAEDTMALMSMGRMTYGATGRVIHLRLGNADFIRPFDRRDSILDSPALRS